MRFLLFVLLLAAWSAVTAQHRQGDVVIDGRSSLRVDAPEDDFYFKGGGFLFDRLLLGVITRADNERLFNTRNNGRLRGDLFGRYYFGERSGFIPYVELGVGAVADSGSYLALQPMVGAEYRFSPGVFGRVSLGYAYSSRSQAVTLEVGSLISLSGWSNKERIPERLEEGQWVLNGHLASLSLSEDGDDVYGLYGWAQVEVDRVLRPYLLVGVDLRYLRTTYLYDPQLEPADSASVTGALEAKYLVPVRNNFVDPYAGLGILYGVSQRVSGTDPDRTPSWETIKITPYLATGVYFHLTERIILNSAVNRYLRDYSPIEGKWRIEIGLALRVG
ncbi:hypothetical protein [Neolewinella sp.]|uniref:hypothetical protein n=1 Tax=Neolewinella sp. TaxID=2993543 RepID=UPI003B51AE80